MKTKAVVLTLALCTAGIAVCFAQSSMPNSAMIGTWKLNEAKSKFGPGATKNGTVKYEAAGDSIKVTVDGTDANGGTVHNEWTGKFDGKDYPVTGDPTEDTRAYKQVNDHTLEFTAKKDGKVTIRGRIELSADGKTRTVNTNTINKEGVRVRSTAVYDKAAA